MIHCFCMWCRPSNTCENWTRKWICQYYRTEITTETECKHSHCRTIIQRLLTATGKRVY